jgi:hypothetical protein
VWCWASPVLTLSYGERQGPALVDLALFGYFATRLIKPGRAGRDQAHLTVMFGVNLTRRDSSTGHGTGWMAGEREIL